jgi:ADP-heptose:LPS heptosyltransferase
MAKILVKVPCPAMGDALCSTPTIRKLSQCYNQKVDVLAVRTDVLTNNPYINNLIPFKSPIEEYDEVFDTFTRSIKVNKGMNASSFYDKGMEIKLANFEARQIHALCAGISLYPNELHYDFTPDEPTPRSLQIDKNYIVLHVTESWPNRTWEVNKWQRLVDLIKTYTDFKIVTIGKSHSELSQHGSLEKRVIKLNNIDFDFCIDDTLLDQSKQNGRESLSEMWHFINNAYGLISFDSGPIHLAGTTDSWIFQIGASIRPEKTAPYRKGSQDYKFKFVGGECKLFCGSCPKYSVKEWKTINSMPYYPDCLEGYKEFKCQPSPDEVFHTFLKNHTNG